MTVLVVYATKDTVTTIFQVDLEPDKSAKKQLYAALAKHKLEDYDEIFVDVMAEEVEALMEVS